MKKTLVALTIAALASSAANATIKLYETADTEIGLYGSVRLLLAKNNGARLDLQNDQSRFWLNVKQRIYGDFWAIGATQMRPFSPYDNNFENKKDDYGFNVTRLYAGIKWDGVGELTFGRQGTTANYFKLADFTYKFGGVTKSGVRWENFGEYRTYGRPQYGIATSGYNTVRFQSDEFNGISFSADYVMGRDSAYHDDNGNKTHDNESYQVGMKYYKKIDDYRLKANFMTGMARIQTKGGTGNNWTQNSVGMAIGFGYKSLDLGFDWVHDTDSKYQKTESQTAWQFGAKYYVTYPWSLYGAYREVEYPDGVHINGFALGTEYKFNYKVLVYGEYATAKASKMNYRTKDDKYGKKGDPMYSAGTDRQHGFYIGTRINF